MKLFFKIFLWFLAAIALMMGVVIFVTRTFQADPANSRFQRSTRNQMVIYSDTAAQIVAAEGEDGLRKFLTRLQDVEPPRRVDLVAPDGSSYFGTGEDAHNYADLVVRTRESKSAETNFSSEERSLAAAPVTFPDGREFVLVLQWERTAPPSLFFGSLQANLRLAGIFLTGTLLCYILALYLTSPIRKLREATRKISLGDLRTRVSGRVVKRRDELGDLAKDFDEMAERIESLITSQQRLTQDISHELRSPLARMNVALEIAKQKANPESIPLLERIENESMRLNEMISRILTLAKLESGAEEYDLRRINLSELVRDIAADADFEARANEKVVEVSADDKVTVTGSENLLRSAIENVLRNAVRYTAERSVVNVDLKARNGNAVIEVTDHGGGVPEDQLEHLFRPFYRVGTDRTRRTGGTGLGLAIADRAIKAHKGSISAANYNGGLRVVITLNSN
jgi:signal transduction histidine kinase